MKVVCVNIKSKILKGEYLGIISLRNKSPTSKTEKLGNHLFWGGNGEEFGKPDSEK